MQIVHRSTIAGRTNRMQNTLNGILIHVHDAPNLTMQCRGNISNISHQNSWIVHGEDGKKK